MLSLAEISAVIAKAPAEIRALLSYLAQTGVRVGPALWTERRWIDLPKRLVHYPARAMKGRHAHTVELNDDAVAALKSGLAIYPDAPFPFSY
jgi:integrase